MIESVASLKRYGTELLPSEKAHWPKKQDMCLNSVSQIFSCLTGWLIEFFWVLGSYEMGNNSYTPELQTSFTAGGNVDWLVTMENSVAVSKKIRSKVTIWLSNSSPG